MAKLVIQNQGMTGRAHELNMDRTTIGRVEDNTFQIADPSVSSHHCEVHLRGSEIFIRDLNSTNGSFINGNKITERVLKPGQMLRLGQVELKAGSGRRSRQCLRPGSAPAPAKKAGGRHDAHAARREHGRFGKRRTSAGFRHEHGFSKKTNKVKQIFRHHRHRRCRDCGCCLTRFRRPVP